MSTLPPGPSGASGPSASSASYPTVPWSAVNARRLERNRLTAPAPAATSPADVAATLLGAHAQVMSAAELSLATRIEGARRTDVREALWTGHSLVKTYGPRGTVHLLATRDLPMWTGALSAVPRPAGVTTKGTDGAPLLTPDQVTAVLAAIGDALAEDELTVDELTEAVVARAGAWAGDRVMDAFQDRWPRWRAVTHLAGHAGVLCFGPLRGRKVTCTNPHRWLPGFRPMDGRAALTELTVRYLTSYGPAAPAHFAQWLAAPRGWAAELFASLEADGTLERVLLDGEAAWCPAGDAAAYGGGQGTAGAAPAPPAVRLLPYFDAFPVASHPRRRLFPGRAHERATARGQAGNFPVLLVDGTVAGVWHQRRAGRRIHLTVEPLEPLTSAQEEALAAEAAKLGHMLEGSAELTVGEVRVGAHA